MDLQEGLLAAISVISSLIIIILVVGLGWYLVWRLFLSRFKLVRELLGLMTDSQTSTKSDTEKTKSSGKTKKLRKD